MSDKIKDFINKVVEENYIKEIEELFVDFMDDMILEKFEKGVYQYIKRFEYHRGGIEIALEPSNIFEGIRKFRDILDDKKIDTVEITDDRFFNLLTIYCQKKGYNYDCKFIDSYYCPRSKNVLERFKIGIPVEI